VHRTLGELDGPGAGLRDSRETLLAYLDEERSVNAVAKQLHVARNTVSYRVKRAEALLGRSIADRQLELHVALLLERAIGSARES
jgi:DNA-binding PucR family transcriptional regulator